MDDLFREWLEEALSYYDKVIFLYQPSQELYSELGTILKKEKRKILLLLGSDIENQDFLCNQRKLCVDECKCFLELYFLYSFSEKFIFLTEKKIFPWPSITDFAELGFSTRGEILRAMLQ